MICFYRSCFIYKISFKFHYQMISLHTSCFLYNVKLRPPKIELSYQNDNTGLDISYKYYCFVSLAQTFEHSLFLDTSYFKIVTLFLPCCKLGQFEENYLTRFETYKISAVLRNSDTSQVTNFSSTKWLNSANHVYHPKTHKSSFLKAFF